MGPLAAPWARSPTSSHPRMEGRALLSQCAAERAVCGAPVRDSKRYLVIESTELRKSGRQLGQNPRALRWLRWCEAPGCDPAHGRKCKRASRLTGGPLFLAEAATSFRPRQWARSCCEAHKKRRGRDRQRPH